MHIEPPEFSRILSLDQIGITGVDYKVEAKEAELKLLANRFELVSILKLRAEFTLLQADEPDCFRIMGTLESDVVQSCVVTLKDVSAHVSAKILMNYRPSQGDDQDEEFEIDLYDDADTEFYKTPEIDLGEIAAQYLFLNLDPFPRAPDAPKLTKAEAEEERLNPFAQALKGLKKD